MNETYPPLTSLDVLPLHGSRVGDRDAPFACKGEWQFEAVFFDWRCPECVQRAIGYCEVLGDQELRWVPANGEPEQVVMLSWQIARSLFWKRRGAEQ